MSPFLLYILLLLLLPNAERRPIDKRRCCSNRRRRGHRMCGYYQATATTATHTQPQFSNDTRALVVVVDVPKMLRFRWTHYKNKYVHIKIVNLRVGGMRESSHVAFVTAAAVALYRALLSSSSIPKGAWRKEAKFIFLPIATTHTK